jgi:glycosyltransferase involved in cell wall biosynthesis
MNIAFDARYLSMVIAHRANPEMLMGIGSYSYHLIKRLSEDFTGDRYFLICDTAQEQIAKILPKTTVIGVPMAPQFRVANSAFGRLYRGMVFDRAVLPPVLKKHKIDVLHYLSQDAFIQMGTGSAVAVTVHDLAISRYPQLVFKAKSAIKVWNYQTKRLGRADFIITDSEASRTDVLKYCQARPERVSTVYCGKDESLSPEPRSDDRMTLEGYGIRTPYFLHVGGIQASKNMDNLVRGFALFSREHPEYHLVVAGELGFSAREKTQLQQGLSESGLSEKTIMPGFIGQKDLAAVYRGAQALVHPSWYEGFGLTPLEAAACGCPAVISDRGSLPEVMGAAAIYVDPADPASIAGGLKKACLRELREKIIPLGLAQAARFSWDQTARQVNEIYKSIGTAT